MRIPNVITVGKTQVKVRRMILALSFLLLVVGVGFALYRTDTTITVNAQGGQVIETIGLTSQLKGNATKTFGPIPAIQGNWFGLDSFSNKSISLQIKSNLTGAIFNSTQTEFDAVVLVNNSTDYFVTAANSKGATALLTGNVTLVVLSSAETLVQTSKRPFLVPGAALSIFGGFAFLYTALPKNATKRRSFERLFP